MAIDLNATLVGINNTVTYTEGSGPISIAPTARVGMGSTVFNTDRWVQMKLAMLNPQAGDLWFIKSLPPGMSVSAISGGAPLPLPLELSIVTYPVLYLNGSPRTPDSSWQEALAAIRYSDSGEVLPGEAARQIAVTGSTGTAVGPTASVTVNMVPVNDAPSARADSGTAVEAGGINNGSLSRPASGNVLLNDLDPDNATNTLRVTVTAGEGRALVELGADASGTQLNLGDGHRAQLHVKADATAQATDAVQIRLEGGARNTWVDASDATAELHVMALDGWGTIQMGGLTRVSVAQGMDRLEIQQGQHTPWKDLVLEMADASFDFNQLFTADGQQGKFLRTEVDGLRAYETRWYHASGQFTELRYVGDDLDSVEITTLNGAVRRSLDDLVASPLAQA